MPGMWGAWPLLGVSLPAIKQYLKQLRRLGHEKLGGAQFLWKRKLSEYLRPIMCHRQMPLELSFCPSGGSNLRSLHSGSWASPLCSWALSMPLKHSKWCGLYRPLDCAETVKWKKLIFLMSCLWQGTHYVEAGFRLTQYLFAPCIGPRKLLQI